MLKRNVGALPVILALLFMAVMVLYRIMFSSHH